MANINLSIEEAYKILGIPFNSTQEEVEAVYKKLLIKYHPDNFASKSKQEQRYAEQKLSEIITAKNVISKNNVGYSANNYRYRQNSETTYKKSMTKEEYDEYFQREFEDLKKTFEEMKRKEAEEYKMLKRKIKKIIIFATLYISAVSLSPALLKSALEKLRNVLDDSKINKDATSIDNATKDSLIKIHTLKETDTLEQLAYEANCTKEEILSINENIEVGSKIRIPYDITEEDLDYYLETIDYDSKQDLEAIAKEHNTDIQTLKRINSEAIMKMGNITIIIGDTLEVPNFISKEELKVKKEDSKEKVYAK